MLKRREFNCLQPDWNPIEFLICLNGSIRYMALSIILIISMLPAAQGIDKKPSSEEAQFDIYVAGKGIGREKFSILFSADSASSSSILDFSNPGSKPQNMHIETQLDMDSRFLPRTYQLRTDIDGQKGILKGTFTPGQAIFAYGGSGNPRKGGLLVGDQYSILDTNIFHHFVFIARLFNFDSKEKLQSFEVVVPQEMDNGIIKISEVGMERTQVRAGKKNLHHLKADSGSLVIDLWVDDQRILYKIALPSKKIEVIRN